MIDYSEDWIITLLFHVRGSVAIRASIFAIPAAAIAFLLVQLDEWKPELREDLGILDLDKSQLWSATTAVLGLLLGFRTNRAMARFWEGTGLLHQMRGEWFDSISCCVTFSVGAVAARKDDVINFRHTAVRLMSLCHGSALEEIAGESGEEVETIDPFGLDDKTLSHLNACKEKHNFNRVEVLLHLTQSIITKALEDGILKIPPPILSRVYQTLSRGFVNLLNAKKIADTRFPFPYAQLITMLLFLHLLLTPLFISSIVTNRFWASLMTFVPIFAMFSVNFIGVELENPFGSDDNDLPLDHFQGEMNKCLMMLLQEGADLIAGVSPARCIFDYAALATTVNTTHSPTETKEKVNKGEQPTRHARLTDFCADIDGEGKADIYRQDEVLDPASIGNDGFASIAFSAQAPPPAPTPVAPPTIQLPKQEEKLVLEPKALNVETTATLSDYNQTLPVLKDLVEAQVRELSASIQALTEFSNALPAVVDSMRSGKADVQSQSQWSRHRAKVNSLLTSTGGSSQHGGTGKSQQVSQLVCISCPQTEVTREDTEPMETFGSSAEGDILSQMNQNHQRPVIPVLQMPVIPLSGSRTHVPPN